jgi:small subunit ribosomal protein S17
MSTATPGQRNSRKTSSASSPAAWATSPIKVTIPYKTPHPRYHKVINRKTVVHVHDEKNEAKVGDKVEVMETRPISRLKRWRVVSVVEPPVTATARPSPRPMSPPPCPPRTSPKPPRPPAPSASLTL